MSIRRLPDSPSTTDLDRGLHEAVAYYGLSARHIGYVKALEQLARRVVDVLPLIDGDAWTDMERRYVSRELRLGLADVVERGTVKP